MLEKAFDQGGTKATVMGCGSMACHPQNCLDLVSFGYILFFLAFGKKRVLLQHPASTHVQRQHL